MHSGHGGYSGVGRHRLVNRKQKVHSVCKWFGQSTATKAALERRGGVVRGYAAARNQHTHIHTYTFSHTLTLTLTPTAICNLVFGKMKNFCFVKNENKWNALCTRYMHPWPRKRERGRESVCECVLCIKRIVLKIATLQISSFFGMTWVSCSSWLHWRETFYSLLEIWSKIDI